METNWINVKVKHKEQAAEGIAAFTLVPAEGGDLPPFEAGAHVDVELPNGLVRQYSLCGSPSNTASYELGILLEEEGRGGSRSAHEDVQEGAALRISEPRNLFPLEPSGRSILLAGGIGVTPILAMAEALSAAGREFEFHYCCRSPKRAAFLERITKSPYADKVFVHYDDGDDAQKLNAKDILGMPDPDTHVYFCGPEGFIDFVLKTTGELGWQDANVHLERFDAVPMIEEGDGSFEVEIASSGKTIQVAADQTVLDALVNAGVDVPVSCEQGICGTCIMKVLEGEPDHRDMFFTDEEHAANDQFTPCCSRAKTSRLVIDF